MSGNRFLPPPSDMGEKRRGLWRGRHPDKTRTVAMNLADSHFDFLGYRFQRSRYGKMMRLVRPKSLRELRGSIKPRTLRNNGKSMEAIVANLNRTLPG